MPCIEACDRRKVKEELSLTAKAKTKLDAPQSSVPKPILSFIVASLNISYSIPD
jgi:hypothetical protein